MNLVSELENELVQALLVEKTNFEQIDPESAIALIKNIKAVLKSNLNARRINKAKMTAGKRVGIFSH